MARLRPWKSVAVTADAAVKPGGPCVLGGVICTSNGTLAGLFDNASAASGKTMFPSLAMTAGQVVLFGERGLNCDNGIYADWTSGAFLVLYDDA